MLCTPLIILVMGVYVCIDKSKKPNEDGRVFATYDSNYESEYSGVNDFVRLCLDELWSLGYIEDLLDLKEFEISDAVMLMRALEVRAGCPHMDVWVGEISI